MDNKLAALLTAFFLSFGIFATVLVFNKPLTQLIRASQETGPSSTNSMVFAWPLTVKADGISQSVITVFLRNERKYPVANKPVTIISNLGQLKQAQAFTENDGRATFQISSQTPGIAQLTVYSGNVELAQKVSIKFE